MIEFNSRKFYYVMTLLGEQANNLLADFFLRSSNLLTQHALQNLLN